MLINECGVIGGMRIGRFSMSTKVLGEIPLQCHFVHYNSYMS